MAQDETKTDLTRIDQLPTLEHQDDPAIDQLFAEQAAAEEAGKFSALEDEVPAEVLAENDGHSDESLAPSAEDEAAPPIAPDDARNNFSSDFWADTAAGMDASDQNSLSENAEPELDPTSDSAISETNSETETETANESESAINSASNSDGLAENGEANLSAAWAAENYEADLPPADDSAASFAEEENPAFPTPTEDDHDAELDLAPLPDPSAAQEAAAEVAQEEATATTPAPSPDHNPAAIPNESNDAAMDAPEDTTNNVAAPPPPANDATPPPPTNPPAYQEFPQIKTTVVDVPPFKPDTTDKTCTMQEFASAVFPANVSSAAPAYSLKLEDIDPDQHEAIMAIIREAKIYAPADEKLLAQGLASGRLLIAQISEYMAITLAHQLRRLTGKLVWGLAQDVHPSASYPAEENRGTASNSLPGQNSAQSYDVHHAGRELSSIILTTAPQVAGHTIQRYLDLVTEQAFLRPSQLGPQKSDLLNSPEDKAVDVSEEIASWDIYRDLCLRLRQKAFTAQADAIVNLNFTLQPIFLASGERGHHLRATGNLVAFTPVARP